MHRMLSGTTHFLSVNVKCPKSCKFHGVCTCQTWIWFKWLNRYFPKRANVPNREIDEACSIIEDDLPIENVSGDPWQLSTTLTAWNYLCTFGASSHWLLSIVIGYVTLTAITRTNILIPSHHDDVIRSKHLCGEFTGYRWIPHTKASDAELWCFLWSAPE